MAKAETAIENLEERSRAVEKKLDRFQIWFMSLMGTSIVSLILLVANLLNKGGN
jgi:hypothetical protein